MDLFSRFTVEMIDATKTMVAECEAINLTDPAIGELKYFHSDHDFDGSVGRVGIDGDSAYTIVYSVMTLLERCNCDADRIWFCEGSLGDVDYKYLPTCGELWFVTGTEEEALEKIRATAEVVRQMENT